AFLVQRELDRLAAVEADDRLALLVALAHGRDVAQAHRHAAGRLRTAGAARAHRRGQHRGVARGRRDPRHLVGGAVVAGLHGARAEQPVADLLLACELVHGADEVTLRAFLEAAAGNAAVLPLQALDHGVDRPSEPGQLAAVHGHLDLVLEAAAAL